MIGAFFGKPQKEEMMPTWDESIKQVLRDAGTPMHYAAIADKIGELKLKELGANAPYSVSAVITTSIVNDKNSPYVRTEKGKYALKDSFLSGLSDAVDPAEDTAGINAFGLHWDRWKVKWGATPEILGASSEGATPVDFHDQKGVYILYNSALRPVYVGQSVDALGKRLKAHNINRLKGRWEYFSWFGFRKVNDETGELDEVLVADGDFGRLASMLEAVLIEVMEPSLNRQRGEGIEGAEFLQVASPEYAKEKAESAIRELLKGKLDI